MDTILFNTIAILTIIVFGSFTLLLLYLIINYIIYDIKYKKYVKEYNNLILNKQKGKK